MNLPSEEVVFALDAIQEPISLFEPIYHDGGDPIFVMDQISDEKNQDEQWLRGISIREAMQRLGEREKNILNLRFFQGNSDGSSSRNWNISSTGFKIGKAALKHIKIHLMELKDK